MIAEGSFECYNTFEKLKSKLLEIGIREDQIRKVASTGIIVDIWGKGEESEEGECWGIAFRADIDALKMAESNDLPYKSTTNHAHMCGHDGHMANLMAFATLI